MASWRGLHAYYIWVLYNIYNIYERKRIRQKDNTAHLNDPNIYIRDVIAMFKLFAKAHPLIKKISHYYHHIAMQALRSYIHVSAFALVVY